MSVFATYAKSHHARSLGVLFAAVVVVLGTVYFGRTIRDPLTAMVLDAGIPSFTPVIDREMTYPQPRRIVWDGVVVSSLAGGEGFAVRQSDAEGFFQAYLATGVTSQITEGPVRITGRLTGISCAYAQTLFEGRCTPSVEIESIESLPVELW